MSKVSDIRYQMAALRIELREAQSATKAEIGATVREARKLRGLNQLELGELIGVGRSQVANIEGGYAWLTVPNLMAVCIELGISSDKLLGLKAEKAALQQEGKPNG